MIVDVHTVPSNVSGCLSRAAGAASPETLYPCRIHPG